MQAAKQLEAGEGPGFEVSGTGALLPLEDQAKSQGRSQSPAVSSLRASALGREAAGSLARIDSRLEQAQSPSQSLIMGRLTTILLAVCSLLVWRARKSRSIFAARTIALRTHQTQRSVILLKALQQELNRLEADRRRGLISGEEYISTQNALEDTLKRVVARAR